MPTKDELRMLQALPLEIKVRKTEQRIIEFVDYYGEDGVFVSFSGGKDSRVLLHITRNLYPNIEAVYVDTGLEYPEIRQFVKTFDNVTILRPKMRFDEVIKRNGYPMISKEISNTIREVRRSIDIGGDYKQLQRYKRLTGEYLDSYGNVSKFCCEKYEPLLHTDFRIGEMCCNIMKKNPVHQFERETGKHSIIATMTEESKLRETTWLQRGCNAFEGSIKSAPMSFWREQDVLQYIKNHNLSLASVYGDIVETDADGCEYSFNLVGERVGKLKTTGCNRTGCIFCGFGCHLEKEPTRFQRLKETHPKQYNYCLNGGEYDEKGMWIPNKDGLGMKHIFDELNKLYGKDFIKYE